MTRCPQCGAPVEPVEGYPDWCDCGWNLKPPPVPDAGGGRFALLAERLARRSGDRVIRTLDARWTAARLAAYAIALGVHLLALALIAGGVAAIVLEFPNVISILIGLAMLGVGLLMRPRTNRLPEGVRPLDAARSPALHELVGAVARELDRPPPDRIVLDAGWNAGWTVVGLRRERVLILGLPLLTALEPGERVALIAHELGHDRNGDARQGLVVGGAVAALDQLSSVLRQRGLDEAVDEIGLGPVDVLANALLWIVSRPVDAVLWLEARLLLRDMQRAEYLADDMAARAAGTDAVIALHEHLLLASSVELAVQQAGDVEDLGHVRDAVRSVPERERERRRRVARLEPARLDDTHPPTGMRIALLEDRPDRPPAVTLNRAWSERIDAELAAYEGPVARELTDAYRSSLYYG